MEGIMLPEKHNPMGSVMGSASVSGTVAVVMAVVVAMVMAMIMPMVVAMIGTMMVVVSPMGPIVGIDDDKIQRGQELGELEAPIVVAVCFGKEVADVLINRHIGLQQDKHGQSQENPREKGLWELPATPMAQGGHFEDLKPGLCLALTGVVL